MKKNKSIAVDRISELPEPILHHILKRLPFIEVARTCVLSKKWEQVWGTYPSFEINESIINHDGDCDETEVAEKIIRAIDCLEQTLRNRLCKGFVNMEELLININMSGCHEDVFVKRCLCYAIASNIKRLYLCFDGIKRYDLPPVALCSNSVEVLTLYSCNIRMPITDWKMSSLTRLVMSDVCLDDFVLKSILAGCPLLGRLWLSNCKGLRTVELFGHKKLDDIGIFLACGLKKVDIREMNISSLYVEQVKQIEISVTNCKNLEKLTLTGAVLKGNRLSNLISELLKLEYLWLQDCFDVEKLNISSASLKRLEVYDRYWFVDLEMDTPNLSCFTYCGPVINLCSNALALSKVQLAIYSPGTVEEYVNFVEFISQFHGCSARLKLNSDDFFPEQVLVAAEELRHKLPPPLFSYPGIIKLKRLKDCPLSTLSMAKLMDELLWIFSHTKTLCLDLNESLSITCKFSYKKSLVCEKGESISCCKSVPLLCWKECIDKVEVKMLVKEMSRAAGEEHHCLEGAEFLEKIDGLCSRNV